MARTTVEALLAKDEINDALLRYCRGLDRNDRELLLSAYHPDAMHDHGSFFAGPASEYVEKMTGPRPEGRIALHYLTNVLIDLDGDQAHCECRWMSINGMREADNLRISWGRYVDRFEDRGDGWKIAARVVVCEDTGIMTLSDPASAEMLNSYGPSSFDHGDISYVRPLVAPLDRSG
jgi:hypothetical protein